ncbi:MAG: three-Cys-motif partner protein TcmP [Candidatus Bipolaricaulota bacterium]|nr:three-Cys-motif partner protein TcmP [Candidatus Bipolaricaulota bacterium]
MSDDFFDTKKPWSFYKDRVLTHYLWPYLSKIRTRGAPILVVDCCAGPGRYRKDGESGSPRIIAERLRDLAERHPATRIRGVYIEKRAGYFAELRTNLAEFGDRALCIHARYQDNLAGIAQLAERASVFLYVDPFTAKELPFDELSKVFGLVHTGSSVEFLLNFDADGVVRWGRSLLRGKGVLVGALLEGEEGERDVEEEPEDSYAELCRVLDGDWWADVLARDEPLREQQERVCEEYKKRLRVLMPYVGGVAIRRKCDSIPKYHMVFGTRHPDGLLLMNDSMARTNQEALDDQFSDGFLFDTAPEGRRPDEEALVRELREVIKQNPGLRRPQVFAKYLEQDSCSAFARYPEKSLMAAVRTLLGHGIIIRRPERGAIDRAQLFLA